MRDQLSWTIVTYSPPIEPATEAGGSTEWTCPGDPHPPTKDIHRAWSELGPGPLRVGGLDTSVEDLIICCSTCSEITGLGAVGFMHWSPGVRVLFTPSLGSSDCSDGQQPALSQAVRSSSHPVHQPLDPLVTVRIVLRPHWTPWSHSGHLCGLPSDHWTPWTQSGCPHIPCEGLVPADLAPSLVMLPPQ